MTEFHSRFEQAKDKDFWLSLNPDLHITDEPKHFEQAPLQIEPEVLQSVRASLKEEGYFQIEKLLDPHMVQRLAAGVTAVHNAGWPTPFVVVYDEYWELFHSLQQMYEAVLGKGYKQVPNFWAWFVDANKDSKGWGHHRDRSLNTLLEDGLPKTLTTWIPLSKATPANGCIYIVPASRDPNFPPGDLNLCDLTEPQSIRALPAEEGDVLGWTEALLHWGSRSSNKASNPRISISYTFQRGDSNAYEYPLFDPTRYPTVDERLGLISHNILRYQNHSKASPETLFACRRLAGLIPTVWPDDGRDLEVLEEDKKLSESLLWKKQKEHFETDPTATWIQKRFYSTNRMIFVEACTEMTLNVLLDCKDLIDATEPVYIIEIGGGTGCFAYRFLNEFFESREHFELLRNINVKYILTDYAENIAKKWLKDRNFKALIDKGVIDFAVYNPQIDKTIELLISKEIIDSKTTSNPTIVFANHVFDHMEQDAFRTIQDVLQESKLTLYKKKYAKKETVEDELKNIRIIERFFDTEESHYDQEIFNKILRTYSNDLDGDATFTFPIGALKSIENLASLCHEKLILISADEGFIHLDSEDIAGLKPLDFSRDGSIAFQINFDALSKYFKMNDGTSLVEPTDYIGLRVAFNSLIHNRFSNTKHFFKHNLTKKNMLDSEYQIANLIRHGLTAEVYDTSHVALFLSIVRTFNFDPTMFSIAHKALLDDKMEHIENISKRLTDELKETIERTIKNIFIIDEDYAIFDSILRLYIQLDWHEVSLKFAEEIIEVFGEIGTALDHAAINCEALKNHRKAYEYFQKSTRRNDTNYEWAKAGMIRNANELVRQGDSIVRVTLAKAK